MKRFSKIVRITLLVLAALFVARTSSASTDAKVEHALKLIEIGNSRQAIKDLQALIASNPKNAEAHAGLVMAYLEENNIAQAQAEAAIAYDLDRKSVLVRIARGTLNGAQHNVPDALKEFNAAIKLNEKDVKSYLALAHYYLSLDSLKPAEITLYRAQAIDDKEISTYLGLADLYEKQRIPDLAISQYESAMKIAPTDIRVSARLASMYRRARRYTESLKEWFKVVQMDSTYANAYYQIGTIYFLAEQYPNAVANAKKYTELDPDDVFGYWLLARAYTENAQYAAALPALEKVAQNDSLKALSQLLLARSYLYSKEFPKAVEIYKSSRVLDPEGYYYYGNALVYSGDTSGGIAQLKQSLVNDTIRKDASKLATRREIASLLFAQKKYDESAAIFEQIASEHPTVEGYLPAAQIYGSGGNMAKALEMYGKAQAIDPNSAKVWFAVGQLYASKDPTSPKMQEAFEKVAALSANNKDTLGLAHGWLGYHSLMMKDFDGAIKVLDQSITEVDAKSPFRLNFVLMLAQAYHSKQDLKHAEEYYKKVLEADPSNKSAKDGMELIKTAQAGGAPAPEKKKGKK